MTDYKHVAAALQQILNTPAGEIREAEVRAAIELCEAAAGPEDERAYCTAEILRAKREDSLTAAIDWLQQVRGLARAGGHVAGYTRAEHELLPRTEAVAVLIHSVARDRTELQAKYDALVGAARSYSECWARGDVSRGAAEMLKLRELLP